MAQGGDGQLVGGVRALIEELLEVALPGYVLALNPQEEGKDVGSFSERMSALGREVMQETAGFKRQVEHHI